MKSQQPRLLNCRQAADYLGLSESFFRKKVREKIPTVTPDGGGKPRYDVIDLDAYIASKRVDPKATNAEAVNA